MAPQCQRTCLAVFLIFGSSLACSGSTSYYVAKGKQLRAKGKFEEAVLNFQKAIKKDPRNGVAYLDLAAVSVQRKHGRGAYSALVRSVELLPGNQEAEKELVDVCLAGYVSDPSHPKKLYDQVDDISRRLLGADPDSFSLDHPQRSPLRGRGAVWAGC